MTAAFDAGRSMLVVATLPGTARVFLLPYAHHFRDQGWQVDLVTGGTELDGTLLRAAYDRLHVVPWGRSISNPVKALRAFRGARKLISDNGYDVVHTHTPVASLIARLAVRSLPRARRPRVVYTAHGFHFHPRGSTAKNNVYALAERVAGRWTDLLIVINDQDYREALRRRIVPAERLVHLPGIGLDVDHYRPTTALADEADKLRVRLGIARDRVVFTMVAEFQPGKNHRIAIEALRLHPEPRPLLLLAGVGPVEKAVREQVAQAGLSDDVIFLGNVLDVRPLYLASDATLLPSSREGLSRAVLESVTIGVPVIGGDTRGIADIVDHESGILVEPTDAVALSRAMQEILAIPGRGAMRPAVEARMRQYSVEALVKRHEELYADLFARTADGETRAS